MRDLTGTTSADLERLQRLAQETFNSQMDASTWLHSSHPLLDGAAPLELAKSADGIERVINLLMRDALRLSGVKTKREAVELGLRTLLRLRQQEEIRRFRGKLTWQGDLGAMRTDK